MDNKELTQIFFECINNTDKMFVMFLFGVVIKTEIEYKTKEKAYIA